jgi:uncharacterized protein YndB with AHSA1/START domain
MNPPSQAASPRCVRRSRIVPASPAAVFALLSDPEQHVALDGSGTVQAVVEAPARLQPGSEFVMRMKGYTTRNRVVEHRADELIAWRHRARHVWRWELRPVAGGTEVTATFDHSAKRCAPVVAALGLPSKAGTSLEKTLEKLHARLA